MRSYGVMVSNLSPRHCPASWLLLGAILALQAAVSAAGGPDTVSGWYLNFGLSRDGFLSGRIWQIFSYGFLHGGWAHAWMNALCVLAVGSKVERTLGMKGLAAGSLFGLVGGALAHLAIGGEDQALLVGFSGACVGFLLIVTTLSPESRMWPIPVSGRSLGLGILTAELLLALANPAVGIPGFSGMGQGLVARGYGAWFQIGHACHFGGGFAGWLYASWLLRPRVTLEQLRRDRERRENGIL